MNTHSIQTAIRTTAGALAMMTIAGATLFGATAVQATYVEGYSPLACVAKNPEYAHQLSRGPRGLVNESTDRNTVVVCTFNDQFQNQRGGNYCGDTHAGWNIGMRFGMDPTVSAEPAKVVLLRSNVVWPASNVDTFESIGKKFNKWTSYSSNPLASHDPTQFRRYEQSNLFVRLDCANEIIPHVSAAHVTLPPGSVLTYIHYGSIDAQ